MIVSRPPSVGTVLDRLRAHYGDPAPRRPNDPLDELIATILSQHTSDTNTARAFAGLKSRFPTWDEVVAAPTDAVADAIRSGGLARIKAPRIQRVLRTVHARRGEYSLRFLNELPVAEARDWLTSLDGVGPKTAACVLLFACTMPALPGQTTCMSSSARAGHHSWTATPTSGQTSESGQTWQRGRGAARHLYPSPSIAVRVRQPRNTRPPHSHCRTGAESSTSEGKTE